MLKTKLALVATILALVTVGGLAVAAMPASSPRSTLTATVGGSSGCDVPLGSVKSVGAFSVFASTSQPKIGAEVCIQVQFRNTGSSPQTLPALVNLTVSGTGHQTFVFTTHEHVLAPGQSWFGNTLWNSSSLAAGAGAYQVSVEAGNQTTSWALKLA